MDGLMPEAHGRLAGRAEPVALSVASLKPVQSGAKRPGRGLKATAGMASFQ